MKAVIIDVRSPKEFNEGSYPCAINIPSNSYQISDYLMYKDNAICLVCFSGNRAKEVKAKLDQEGFKHVAILENQMVHFSEGKKASETTWTVDRQFRLALGMLIGLFLLGNYILEMPGFVTILAVVFTGLIYSAITDNCYLKILISSLPWNKVKNSTTTV